MKLRFLSICHNYVKLHHRGKLKPYRQCHVYSTKPYCPRENWLLSEALEVWQTFPSLSSDDTSAMVQNWSPRQTVCQQVQSMASMIPTASRVPSRTGRVHSNTTYAVWMLPVRALGNLEHLCIACKENKCKRYFSQRWFRWGIHCSALSRVNWFPSYSFSGLTGNQNRWGLWSKGNIYTRAQGIVLG